MFYIYVSSIFHTFVCTCVNTYKHYSDSLANISMRRFNFYGLGIHAKPKTETNFFVLKMSKLNSRFLSGLVLLVDFFWFGFCFDFSIFLLTSSFTFDTL